MCARAHSQTVCDMIEGRHGLLSLLDEVSSYKDNDGAVLVNRYNRAMATHDHYFCGEEAVFGTGYARKYPPPFPPGLILLTLSLRYSLLGRGAGKLAAGLRENVFLGPFSRCGLFQACHVFLIRNVKLLWCVKGWAQECLLTHDF